MKLHQILESLQEWAPFSYQDSYDNSGLLVGSANAEIHKTLISLDITEEVMQEAVKGGFDLIISHHPIIFQGFKSLTGKTPEEKIVIAAIKNNIAIIAMHTNLDNISEGVSYKLSQVLGLQNQQILSPKKDLLRKLVVFIPNSHLDSVRQAVFNAGAGKIGHYDQCSFGSEGVGTFRAGENTQAFVGKKMEFHQEKEVRFESVFPVQLERKIIKALLNTHPYEEVAYDIFTLNNSHSKVGAGIIAEMPEAISETAFLKLLKNKVNPFQIRHTAFREKKIKKVALCGGSGSFLIDTAKAANADIFITGDVKYHDFFKATKHMIIADVGHYESEQFTKELIHDFLIKKFTNFAVQISEHQTNPIKYF